MKLFCILIIIFLIDPIRFSGQPNSQLAAQNNIQSLIEDDLSLNTTDTINRAADNEATVAVSEDNQFVLSYKDDKGNGNLYISILNDNKWSIPEKINKIVNTEGWEPNECISADGNWLYFTSKRLGGFGGKDIYRSKKLPDGEWSPGMNLGPTINTQNDEEAPILLPDGATLYFSSNGHKSNGGFNLFQSTLSGPEVWTEPVNVGYPINSTNEKEIAETVDEKKKSDFPKEIISDKKDNCILTFKNKKETSFILVRGKVTDLDGKVPEDIKITVTDNETGSIVSRYHASRGTGLFSFMLPPGRNNNITFNADGYLFQSENIDLSWKNLYFRKTDNIKMPLVKEGSKIILNNVFFDSTKSFLLSASDVELDNLSAFLNDDPELVVEISSYITYKEDIKKNKIISQQRADAIVAYLTKKCVSEDQVIAKGYAANSKKHDKKVILENKNTNEWIELTIIKTKKSD